MTQQEAKRLVDIMIVEMPRQHEIEYEFIYRYNGVNHCAIIHADSLNRCLLEWIVKLAQDTNCDISINNLGISENGSSMVQIIFYTMAKTSRNYNPNPERRLV